MVSQLKISENSCSFVDKYTLFGSGLSGLGYMSINMADVLVSLAPKGKLRIQN